MFYNNVIGLRFFFSTLGSYLAVEQGPAVVYILGQSGLHMCALTWVWCVIVEYSIMQFAFFIQYNEVYILYIQIYCLRYFQGSYASTVMMMHGLADILCGGFSTEIL